MPIALFSFIAWVLIIIFFIIKKSLDLVGNIIVLFCSVILITNIYTIIDLNLGLVLHSNRAELFMSLCLHRTVIIPLIMLIYVNVYLRLKQKTSKVVLFSTTFLLLIFIEYLVIILGIKRYTGWNWSFTAITLIVEMLFALWMAKFVKWMSLKEV